MIHVRVPATTANMGPGFDCIGMAFALYNNVWVEECDRKCVIECKNDLEGRVPRSADNMIYQAMRRFYGELGLGPMPGVRIVQEDYIPMARGLGSSAACIVGGLAAANELSGAGLSREDLAFLASKIEGHPDNAAPALLGGVIVGVLSDSKLEYIKIDNDFLRTIRFAALVPSFPLKTEKARGVLPGQYNLSDGVFNASRTALMVAALLTGDASKLMTAMEDRFHQPYREKIIEGMADVFRHCKACGAKSVFLSGAGPTIMAMTDREDFPARVKPCLQPLPGEWDVRFLQPDFDGAVVSIYR